jgi:protein SCO1
MKKVFCLLTMTFVTVLTYGQDYLKESKFTKEVEIGIEEKLGDTIPLDLSFKNEDNETVTLRELIKMPTILMFVYFDCQDICIPMMDGMGVLIGKLDMTLGKDYQVITISFNTKDTPEKAKGIKPNFVQKINMENQKYWSFLTGAQENINSITAATGYKYIPQGLGFSHPVAILVLSPAGKITRYLYGLTYLPFDIKMAIIEAQKGIARPTSSKILDYCFGYNPGSRTYTLQVTRIVGSLMLFIVALGIILLIFRSKKKINNIK